MLAKQQKLEEVQIDEIDRKIIAATQQGLPLTRHPYNDVAASVGVDVAEIISRMKNMTELGVIRRTGVVPNHYKLGFRANGMSVWNVPEDKIAELGKKVGAIDFVSHCYQRPRFLPEWPYNLFAMVHGKSKQEVQQKVTIIAELLGHEDLGHRVLFSTKILKKTGLRIK